VLNQLRDWKVSMGGMWLQSCFLVPTILKTMTVRSSAGDILSQARCGRAKTAKSGAKSTKTALITFKRGLLSEIGKYLL